MKELKKKRLPLYVPFNRALARGITRGSRMGQMSASVEGTLGSSLHQHVWDPSVILHRGFLGLHHVLGALIQQMEVLD